MGGTRIVYTVGILIRVRFSLNHAFSFAAPLFQLHELERPSLGFRV